jgi:flavin-dependent dehydrogenase
LHDVVRTQDFSVLIIGGGPAGLATALELARQHISVVVVERSAYDDVRVGEHLTPAGVLQLRALGPTFSASTDVHGESTGVTAYWGSETAHHTDYFLHPGQHGLNLSRPRFDGELARAAESHGVTIWRFALLRRAVRGNAVWHVEIDRNGSIDQVTISLIVDATGRLATFSRQQGARIRAHDRQVAVVAFLDCENETYLSKRSIIEAAEDGWWYCAPINATRSMCMFVTDHDLLPRGAKHDLRAWWLDQQSQAAYLPHQFRGLAHLREFVIRSARSQCLDALFGSGWLAVGDAAMAFDPLASQGIMKALDHGRRAATSISAYLKGEESSLERFALHLRREYAVFLATRKRYYRLERRWPRSIFWSRRNTVGNCHSDIINQ